MEFINQTCYNTEDLKALWAKVRESYEAQIDIGDHRSWWRTHYKWTEPERIVIGYFKARNQNESYPSYTSIRHKPVLRLGIVKKGDIPWGPALTALAEAANGKEMRIPPIVVKQIAAAFISCAGAYRGMAVMPIVDGEQSHSHYQSRESDTSHWTWINDFAVRFNDRAKRGSRAAAARARKLGRLDQMRKEIDAAKQTIAEQQAIIQQHQSELKDLEQELAESVAAMEAAEVELASETEALSKEK